MKKLLPLMLVALLSACSVTPNALRESAPSLDLSAQDDSEQLAMCITEGWENLSTTGSSPVVNYRPTEHGHTVSLYISGTLSYLADIEDVDDGSEVKIYNNTFGLTKEPAFEAVKGCAAS